MTDELDDIPQLSAETFNILQQFYAEQEEKEQSVRNNAIKENNQFQEDWQLSQFWYDEKTINTLVRISLASVKDNDKIVLISCPSLYNKLKKGASEKNCSVTLMEFDTRFAVHSDFIHYDYNKPLNIDKDLKKSFDLVLADPPFLSEECLENTAETIRFLAKDKIVLCTGATMETLAEEKLCVRRTKFLPKHENNLANEFFCYANFDVDTLLNDIIKD